MSMIEEIEGNMAKELFKKEEAGIKNLKALEAEHQALIKKMILAVQGQMEITESLLHLQLPVSPFSDDAIEKVDRIIMFNSGR